MTTGDPYIDSSDLAAYLKVTVSGNEPQLNLAAVSASRWIEGYCRRQFNLDATATARHFDVRPSGISASSGTVLVDDIGNATLTVATDTLLDGTFATTWASTDLQTAPLDAIAKGRPITELLPVGVLRFAAPSTFRTGLVRVTARWGWPEVPDAVVQAAYIEAGHLYKRRESTEGVLGFGQFGPVRVGSHVDPDVETLLADYRLAPSFG